MHIRSSHILLLVLLTAMFASCRGFNTPDTDEAEIRFTGSKSVTTRAVEPLPADYTMWVQGLYHYKERHSFYFHEAQAFSCTDGIWAGAAWEYYYPLSGTMDFLAYAIRGEGNLPTATFATNENNTDFTGLTLNFENKLSGYTDAALYSEIKKGAACGLAATTLPLIFHHALSSIVFTARTFDEDVSSRFVIHNITVKNVKASGMVYISEVTTSSSDGSMIMTSWDAQWQQPLTGSAKSLSVIDSESSSTQVKPALLSSESTASGTQVGRILYLPTQSDSPQTISIDLKYSILNGTGYNSTQQHVITITLPAVQWLPEHQYTYTVTCSLTQITVTATDTTTGAILDYTPESIDIDEIYHDDKPV